MLLKSKACALTKTTKKPKIIYFKHQIKQFCPKKTKREEKKKKKKKRKKNRSDNVLYITKHQWLMREKQRQNGKYNLNIIRFSWIPFSFTFLFFNLDFPMSSLYRLCLSSLVWNGFSLLSDPIKKSRNNWECNLGRSKIQSTSSCFQAQHSVPIG